MRWLLLTISFFWSFPLLNSLKLINITVPGKPEVSGVQGFLPGGRPEGAGGQGRAGVSARGEGAGSQGRAGVSARGERARCQGRTRVLPGGRGPGVRGVRRCLFRGVGAGWAGS